MFFLSNIYSNPFSISQTQMLWVLIGVIIVLLTLGIYFYIVYRKKSLEAAQKNRLKESVARARSEELQWYREKRFLMERQAAEKQDRIHDLIESMRPENAHQLSFPASRVFFLAEAIREERQFLGTDISKLSLIDRRLRSLAKECLTRPGKGAKAELWLSEVSLCRQAIQGNREDLRKSQNLLRGILNALSEIEEDARKSRLFQEDIPKVIAELEDSKNRMAELPDELKSIARTTGERTQILFRESSLYLPDLDIHQVWREQMRLDLFSSKHRSGGREALLEAADEAILAFENAKVDSALPTEPETMPKAKKKTHDDAGQPAIAQPISELVEQPVEPVTFPEKSVPSSVWKSPTGSENRQQVIFCSSDPEIWDSSKNEGDEHCAIELDTLNGDFNWLGVRRCDTGEEVFFELEDVNELKANGNGQPVGFNGSNELFYGARHLGLFSEECAPEVETLFTYGGWGFGHLAASPGDDEEETQFCGWNGTQVPRETVFRFTVYNSLPEGVDPSQVVE